MQSHFREREVPSEKAAQNQVLKDGQDLERERPFYFRGPAHSKTGKNMFSATWWLLGAVAKGKIGHLVGYER